MFIVEIAVAFDRSLPILQNTRYPMWFMHKISQSSIIQLQTKANYANLYIRSDFTNNEHALANSYGRYNSIISFHTAFVLRSHLSRKNVFLTLYLV